MRLFPLAACLAATTTLSAQNDIGWIAPEGKILNYRTLVWDDFQGKEDKEHAERLAAQNLRAMAYVCPAIYSEGDSGEVQDNGRIRFRFHVKCAFQSRAFVRESTKEMHTNYVLIHEQDHYDIALTYASRLYTLLSSRDYDKNKYSEEIEKISHDFHEQYFKIQETYDHEVNPEGRDDKEKQSLWDMRIKKAMDNNSIDFLSSPLSVVQTVGVPGQVVKRIPGEGALQFIVRARPLYSEISQDLTARIVQTTEWSEEPAIIAFYTQRYYLGDESAPVENVRTLAYLFLPTAKDTYKRMLIDTFSCGGKPVKIGKVFFANADSDQTRELIITATGTRKNKEASGTLYINKVYDNPARPLQGRLRCLEDASARIEGGFEGTIDGKPSKAKCKTEKDAADILKKTFG